MEQGFKEKALFPGTSGSYFEEFLDEPILTPDATPAQPPHLALPNHVHRLIALNRSSRSLEFAKPLLGAHSPFDCTMVFSMMLFRYWTGPWLWFANNPVCSQNRNRRGWNSVH